MNDQVRPGEFVELAVTGFQALNCVRASQWDVLVGDLVQQLEEATAAGVRVAMLSVDSPGGTEAACYALYGALLRFREAGGAVVAFIAGRAGSSAALYIFGADFIVMHPDADIWPHGLVSDDAESIAFADRAFEAIWRTHTLATLEDVHGWIAERPTPADGKGERLDVLEARDLGMVDFIGCREEALSVTARLARGEAVTSSRRAALEARRAPDEFQDTLRELRVEGALTRELLRWSPAPVPRGARGDAVRALLEDQDRMMRSTREVH